MILRFLGIQGIAGIAVSLALAILLVVQKGETRHWRKQSAGFEQLYSHEQAAFAGTVANTRASAEQARAADKANADRVAAEQLTINEGTANAYETRLAAARARADELRVRSQAAANRGAGGGASVPGLPAAARGAAQAAGQDRLPGSDALTATEQAIQLDELIKWVRAQAAVDNNPAAVASSPGKQAGTR
jgi:hypothetical protein